MDTNNYKIVLTDVAREELEDIYKYISETLLEEPAAKRLMNKIEQSILSVEQNPCKYAKICVKPYNEIYRRLVVDNYIALYGVEDEQKQVVIYRVLNNRKDYLNIIDEIE